MANQDRVSQLFRLDDKIALVTGASKGIGESMARGLAEFGAKVVLSSRKQAAVDAVAEAFQADGLEATGIAANMGNDNDIASLIEQTVELYGGLDIVINNAAANPVYGPLQNTVESAFDKIIDVNLKGPFELCKKAYPILKARGGGSIIHISSIGGIRPEASGPGSAKPCGKIRQPTIASSNRYRSGESANRPTSPGSRFTWRPLRRPTVAAAFTWSTAVTVRTNPHQPLETNHVMKLILGTMTFGDQVEQADAETLLQAFTEAGHDELDSAHTYCDGRTEEMLGRMLPPPARAKLYLASKVNPWHDDGLQPVEV